MVRALPLLTQALAAFRAEQDARDDFTTGGSVSLTGLDPGHPDDQFVIDEASRWAVDPERRGRSRRRIHAAQHRATWEFEIASDATEFSLLFR